MKLNGPIYCVSLLLLTLLDFKQTAWSEAKNSNYLILLPLLLYVSSILWKTKIVLLYEMQIFESILQMNGASNDLQQPIYIFFWNWLNSFHYSPSYVKTLCSGARVHLWLLMLVLVKEGGNWRSVSGKAFCNNFCLLLTFIPSEIKVKWSIKF